MNSVTRTAFSGRAERGTPHLHRGRCARRNQRTRFGQPAVNALKLLLWINQIITTNNASNLCAKRLRIMGK